jgi:hypothetical protein
MAKPKKMANDNRISVCYLYVIGLKDGDTVLPYSKIGISSRVPQRVRDLSTGQPFEVFCHMVHPFEHRLVAQEAEGMMHRELREIHTRGEWFKIHPADAESRIKATFGRVQPRVQRYFSAVDAICKSYEVGDAA